MERWCAASSFQDEDAKEDQGEREREKGKERKEGKTEGTRRRFISKSGLLVSREGGVR